MDIDSTKEPNQGRNMLITGGASGLGASIARFYAQSGARVVIADKNKEFGKSLEEQLQTSGCHVKFVFVNVELVESQVSMFREGLAWLPGNETFDNVILCAGINGNAFDTTPQDPSALGDNDILALLERNSATLQVNLVSTVQTIQLAVKYAMGLELLKKKEHTTIETKSITLIASLASYRALPRAVDYSAAKWGLRGAFRSLRQQLPSIGVRINMIAPAFIKTPLLKDTIPMYENMGVKFATKEDVVAATRHVVETKQCNGRAYAVSSEGFVDLQDDASGKDAFEVVSGLVNRQALGSVGCPIGIDETK